MYRAYTIDELYTQIERRRRIIATITYLSIRQSGSNPTIAPRRQTVSRKETNSFIGGNRQFPRRKLTQRLVVFIFQVGCFHYSPPLCLLIPPLCLMIKPVLLSVYRRAIKCIVYTSSNTLYICMLCEKCRNV